MNERYVLAPGTRILYRGNSTIEIHPPFLGFRQRPVVVQSWALGVIQRLGNPAADSEIVSVLAGIVPEKKIRDLLSELIRFGIVRPHYPMPREAAAPGPDSGFLIFALGDRRYGRLAYNAARSIKACCPACRVAVCHYGAALSELPAERRQVFDAMVECTHDMSHLAGKFAPLWAKLHSDLLTPFEHTVVVDADTMFFPHAAVAQELLRYRDHDFAPTCSFTHLPEQVVPGDRIILWADVAECVRRFQLSRSIRQTHLYYYGLKRSAATHTLFRAARDVYQSLSAQPLKSMSTWHGGRVSAELAMSIATAQCDFALYSGTHMPIMNNAMMFFDGVMAHYLGFTFCGAPPDAGWQARYDAIVQTVTPADVEPYLWSRMAPEA